MNRIDESCDITVDNKIFKNNESNIVPCSNIFKCLTLILNHNTALNCCKKNINDTIEGNETLFTINSIFYCDKELNEDKFLHFIFNYNKYCNNHFKTFKDKIVRNQIRDFCTFSKSLNFNPEIITEKIVFSNVLWLIKNTEKNDSSFDFKNSNLTFMNTMNENSFTTVVLIDIIENSTSAMQLKSKIQSKNNQMINRTYNTNEFSNIAPIYVRNKNVGFKTNEKNSSFLALKNNLTNEFTKNQNIYSLDFKPSDFTQHYVISCIILLFIFLCIFFVKNITCKILKFCKNKNTNIAKTSEINV